MKRVFRKAAKRSTSTARSLASRRSWGPYWEKEQVADDGSASVSLTTFHSFRSPLILVFLIRSASARVSNTLAAGR